LILRHFDLDLKTTWLFDLDNTRHDASYAAFGPTTEAITAYIVEHLEMRAVDDNALRLQDSKRYGVTLLGLVRHHGEPSHFLEEPH